MLGISFRLRPGLPRTTFIPGAGSLFFLVEIMHAALKSADGICLLDIALYKLYCTNCIVGPCAARRPYNCCVVCTTIASQGSL
jgi:hypothetical protein